MLFNSAHFLLFFPIVTLLYFAIPQKLQRVRVLWLLAASYYFYMSWNAVYALLILTSTVVTYGCGLFIGRWRKHTRLWVALSLLINFGILFFFKYQNFAADALKALGLHVPTFDVLLPVGISFYTFQAVGYTIDVCRSDIEPERNFVDYALFVSFFPQLVAGPIERSRNLLHQLKTPHRFDYTRFRSGLWLMLWGFFQKLVVADRLAVIVDMVYKRPETDFGGRILIATIAFSIQVYCDFASYSNIAIGCGRILGINLMQNFRQPYFSASISEFWRRWHISLSTWLKDYLYIPLGGNRKGFLRKNLNLLIVFLVSGLWHGAAWTYVVWGAIHGIYQVIGNTTRPWRDKFLRLIRLNPDGPIVRFFRAILTFILVTAAWIPFRATSLASARTVLKRMFLFNKSWSKFLTFDQKPIWLIVTGCAVLLLLLVDLWHSRSGKVKKDGTVVASATERFARWPLVLRWAVCLVLLFAILIFGAWNTTGFLYFQF